MSLQKIAPRLTAAGHPTTLFWEETVTATGASLGTVTFVWNPATSAWEYSDGTNDYTIEEDAGNWVWTIDGVATKTGPTDIESPIGRYSPDSGPLRLDLRAAAAPLPLTAEVSLSPGAPGANTAEVTLSPGAPGSLIPEV